MGDEQGSEQGSEHGGEQGVGAGRREGRMFRGHYTAKVDERGRVKLPAAFLATVRERFDEELFVTSLDGRHLRVYPLKTWLQIEERLLRVPSMSAARGKLLDRVNFFGQAARLDKVGRFLIPQRLRGGANLDGEVVVLGLLDYLEVWNPSDFAAKLAREELTEEDKRLLSELGI